MWRGGCGNATWHCRRPVREPLSEQRRHARTEATTMASGGDSSAVAGAETPMLAPGVASEGNSAGGCGDQCGSCDCGAPASIQRAATTACASGASACGGTSGQCGSGGCDGGGGGGGCGGTGGGCGSRDVAAVRRVPAAEAAAAGGLVPGPASSAGPGATAAGGGSTDVGTASAPTTATGRAARRRKRPIPASRLCQVCRVARAAVQRPKTGQRVCKQCFFERFEAEVHDTIVRNKLFTRGQRVAIAASGGKGECCPGVRAVLLGTGACARADGVGVLAQTPRCWHTS